MAGARNGQQTAAAAVIQKFKRRRAYDEATAIGYDVLKDIKLTTPVLAYTISNLMDEKVVVRTADERYYFSQAGYKKLEKKVYSGYSLLFLIPIVGIIIFLLLQRIFG
ncbi:MAG: hypothetical protein LKF79_00560 [Solobacterium sp.]|jgi:hypothetical protein|nr:hypothetical protein [Solobacterium sp.]MCH4222377.1 hypothetical protein [Solobacterium sp.]MCH4265118.1 hypothetical protein [Solobacterium sp.]